MKISGMPLTFIKETKNFKYYKAIGYGKGYDYREDNQCNVETKKPGKWIKVDGKKEK
ncbi:MAG: hypothetical protein HDR08_11085 [Lachnospiraceae bacterium]|nr:hypothetical protein [Lachnospiraceae bacterium]